MIHEKRVYSLTCDGCGDMFYDALGLSYYDDYDDLWRAAKKGWVGEVNGEPFGESAYHFCSEKCREDWKKKNN